MTDTVTIVGGGIAGAACAVELGRLGMACRVLDRGRAPGGRMASPLVDDRRVDLGAGYFTVKDDGFAAQVARWEERGLARPWTDTFAVLSSGSEPTSKSGPTRWATPGGLRSLVRDLLTGIDVELESDVTDLGALPQGPVVLAMPDAQASRLAGDLPGLTWLASDPVIAVACGFAERTWDLDAAFVNDDDDLTFVADDGSRRGDGAPVLVAHTTPELAGRHLDDPQATAPVVAAALDRLLHTGTPVWSHVHRWSLAKSSAAHDATHHVEGRLGLAGDQWSPDGPPRVESAWRSGLEVARAIAG
ncbi:MAG: NAD(P)-binding protein [Actinomycetota bacterium]|nr:NAD(P)-binding protein [Actinomycetota bacterium]